MKRIAFWLLRCSLLVAGSAWLLYSALHAFGGHERLWLFSRSEQHRYQAMAILTGTLRLRSSLALLGYDEQVFNGGVYTNWGFGVGLLQLPFHALSARWRTRSFFPDRAIYFAYFAATAALLWAAFQRLLTMRRACASRIERDVLAWAATALVLACALYPLMSCRFIVYEETICYLMLCELAALSAYVFALRSWSLPAVCGMGVASGFGLLVRPTGLIYLGVWGAMTMVESGAKRARIAFAVAIAPFVAFWMVSNWVKGGSPISLGMINQVFMNTGETGVVRFGNHCVDTCGHLLDLSAQLFRAFFVAVPQDAPKWMQTCRYFGFEERPPAAHEPFFGLTVLAILAWISLSFVARRERRLVLYAPLAAIGLMFASYLYAGIGFAWRYVGDFWPFIVLACVQYVRSLPMPANKLLGVPLAAVLCVSGMGGYGRSIEPWQAEGFYGDQWETLAGADAASMWDGFKKARWSVDKSLPSQIRCGEYAGWPPGNAQGWYPGCGVDFVTNVYLGVPRKAVDDRYEVRFKTEQMTATTLRVYLNGHIYTAAGDGTTYRASVRIPYARLNSPIVMATVEWSRGQPPSGKLLSIELG
jgi:hypothetical protein